MNDLTDLVLKFCLFLVAGAETSPFVAGLLREVIVGGLVDAQTNGLGLLREVIGTVAHL